MLVSRLLIRIHRRGYRARTTHKGERRLWDRDRTLGVSPGPDSDRPRETGRWHYFTESGEHHIDAVRLDGPNGKEIRRDPAGVKAPHPLYNVRELLDRPGDPVLFCEGEKTAEAARELFRGHVVVTSLGGSKSARQSRYGPLTSRDIVCWPDNDEPGRAYMDDVRSQCEAAGALSVRIVELLLGLPDGWDLADPVPDGIDIERILEHRPMLPTMSGIEMMAIPDPEYQWLVTDTLLAVGSSVLGGGKAVGKSTAGRALVAAILDGKPWLGRDTVQGRAIYLAHEDSFLTVKHHFRDMRVRNLANLQVMVDRAPTDADRVELLDNTIRKFRPQFVLVDTLFRYVPIKDGNDYAETSSKMEPYVAMGREHELHIMFTHHARKAGGENGDELSGSTGIIAMADTVLSLSRDGDRRMIYGFGRDGVQLEKTILDMDGAGAVRATETKRQSDTREIMVEVLDLLGEHPEPMSGPQVRQGISRGKTAVREALNNLVSDGDILRIGNGPSVRYQAIGTGTQP